MYPEKKKSPKKKKKKKAIKTNPDALLTGEYGKDSEEAPLIDIDKLKKKGKAWMSKLKDKLSPKESAEAAEEEDFEEETEEMVTEVKTPKKDKKKKRKIRKPFGINPKGILGPVVKRQKEQNRQFEELKKTY